MTRRAHLSTHGGGTSRRASRGNPLPPEPRSVSGLLVIRAWFDGDDLRARVTSTTDVTAPDESVVTAAGPDEVMAAVMAWMEGLERARS